MKILVFVLKFNAAFLPLASKKVGLVGNVWRSEKMACSSSHPFISFLFAWDIFFFSFCTYGFHRLASGLYLQGLVRAVQPSVTNAKYIQSEKDQEHWDMIHWKKKTILVTFSPLHSIQVVLRSIGEIYKIRIGHDGTSGKPEWSLQTVLTFLCALYFMLTERASSPRRVGKGKCFRNCPK